MAHETPSLTRKPSGTRREWHEEMAEMKRKSLGSHPPSRMPSVQTRIKRLPAPDEEMAITAGDDRSSSVYDGDNPQAQGGYF